MNNRTKADKIARTRESIEKHRKKRAEKKARMRKINNKDGNPSSEKKEKKNKQPIGGGDRFNALCRCIPGFFNGEGKRLLYVGASWERKDFLPELLDGGYTVDILEPWSRNVEHFVKNWAGRRNGFGEIIEGDVREVDGLLSNEYDVVFWWHGPEHILEEDLEDALNKLEGIALLVVLGAPWGNCPQKAIHGNPYEKHLSAFEPEHFARFGYSVDVLPSKSPDGRGIGSHMTIWKRIKK